MSESESDDYSMRDDQRAAMAELERLQNTRPEDWNEEKDAEFLHLLMEPAPDYEETRSRIEELNARLESEPLPSEVMEHRPTRIRFSENLVSVAPDSEADDPGDDLGEEGGNYGSGDFEEDDGEAATEDEAEELSGHSEDKGDDEGNKNRDDSIDARDLAMPEPAANKEEIDSPSSTSDSQKVVVVNSGRIRFVNSADVQAAETSPASSRQRLRPKSAMSEQQQQQQQQNRQSNSLAHRSGQSSPSQTRSPQRHSQPPPRPSSAPSPQQAARLRYQVEQPNTLAFVQHRYRPEENEAAFQAWLAKKRRDELREKQQKSSPTSPSAAAKTEDNESAFQAWLARKRQQVEAEQKRAERTRQAEEERRRDAEAQRDGVSFERWLETKRSQQQRESDLLQYQRESGEDAEGDRSGQHTPEECRKAYRRWLKKKEEQRKQEEKLERQRARITRLALRRSRKSQALASALLAANSYKYMDYYGYR